MHRVAIWVLSFVAATVLSGLDVPPARADSQVIQLSLQEQFRDKPLIGGKDVVGFTMSGASAKQRPHLEMSLPKSWLGSVACLQLMSDNGQYEGHAEFPVTDAMTAGFVEVGLDTAHPDFLAGSTAQNVASIVRKGACGAEDFSEAAVTVWNEDAVGKAEAAELKINAKGANETYVVVGGQQIPCAKKEGQRMAFSTICRIPAELLSQAEPSDIEINRVMEGVLDTPIFIRVHIGQ